VFGGDIVTYQLMDINEDGEVGKPSEFRNSERLIITFPSGKKLTIGIVSDSAENCMFI